MTVNAVHIVQLPFPSLHKPHERVVDYYREYSRRFSEWIPDYFIPEGSLWELPLWVAHLSGIVEQVGYSSSFCDLTKVTTSAEACLAELLVYTRPGDAVLLSPLAQNFELAIAVSRQLMQEGRYTVLGGNMAVLAKQGDASAIHHGQATPATLRSALFGSERMLTHILSRADKADWLPNYELLEGYRGRVPLLRLNASHGCLYACDFCGDAWSRNLVTVPLNVLEHEVRQFERLFPDTRLIYIGDKTFGQSREAVANLLKVFAHRPRYRFIVQTHVRAINDELLNIMERLGVIVVEMGFESASFDLMRQNHKANGTLDFFTDRILQMNRRGIRVILNVLSGLPGETQRFHDQTVEFIQSARPAGWLYNIYNFVPYPLTPEFSKIRDRIVDWNFADWLEDGLPVFEPYHITREQNFEYFLEKIDVAHRMISGHELHRCRQSVAC